MKRPIKPFVVEVKKGAKTKAPETETLKTQEQKPLAHQLAERKLFAVAPAQNKTERPAGRILESLDIAPPAALVLPDEPARKRGRPKGSRNKPKIEAGPPPIPKKRGRPRRIPEGEVRQVPVTPDLATALLARIGETAPPPPQPSLQVPPAPQAAPTLTNPLESLISAAKAGATLRRLRAGEKWKRRLRGAARDAFERRHARV